MRVLLPTIIALSLCGCFSSNRASETGAIGDIRTLQAAQSKHFSRGGTFADTLSELASDLSPGLASGEEYGYMFSVRAGRDGYEIHADPKVFGRTGRRHFYSDQTMVIRQTWDDKPASVRSQELK